MLKKLSSNYLPCTLREAFDIIMECEKEIQVTQTEPEFSIMENCYEETPPEEAFMNEEVQMRSQTQKQGQYQQGNHPQYQKPQYSRQKNFQGNQQKSGYNPGYKPQYQKGPKPISRKSVTVSRLPTARI